MEDYTPLTKSRVDNLIDRRRDESDARDIIKEVERLGSFEGQHRYRWIWELIQNARDEAGDGVEVICLKEGDRFIFKHNGKPFFSDHLIALTLRSSTKPLDNSNGNAGKFGTGFVTSHLLNKRVKVTGVHQNEEGQRRFIHTLNRTPTDLPQMMESLALSIQNIREIDKITPEEITDPWNCFEYELSPACADIASGGIKQLELNLTFALLINRNSLKSVKIIEENKSRTLRIHITTNTVGDINFVQLVNDSVPESKIGLLYKEYGKLIIAIPAEVQNDKYNLIAIGESAHLFKELPLIGTEDFTIPNIIQHGDFKPTEPRDGVRTKHVSQDENDVDPIGKSNRDAFVDYINAFPNFISQLVNGEVQHLHLLAESGFPQDPDKNYSSKWLKNDLQNPIRKELLKYKLVKTAGGQAILIGEAYFPYCQDALIKDLHSLLAALFPDKVPDEGSYLDWTRIISQENENWPANIMVDIEKLVKTITGIDTISEQLKTIEAVNEWLQNLVWLLEQSQNERLGNEYPIYPTQAGSLSLQNDVFKEVDLDDQFKFISKGLGRDLQSELLPKNFKSKFVQEFDIKEFLNDMNGTIGTLKVEAATEEQIQAIIDICCTFKPSRAERREVWFDLLNRLLPNKVKGKVVLEFKEDYNWDSAEKWTLKMVSLLIQEAGKLETFIEEHFDEEATALKWLNDFLAFVYRNEENKIALEQNIILTQDGIFKKYTDKIYQENNSLEFEPLLKKLFKNQSGFEDPASFLVYKGIFNTNLRITDVSILTRPIDDLFKDSSVEDKVKEGLEYHDLFMALKEFTESERGAKLFPLFTEKQPILFIKAFGAGSSVGRLMKIRKPIEEMEKLAALSLSADQLKQLDDAAKSIGNVQSLIDKANQMAEYAEEVRWRQDVGAAAEQAFLDALAEAHPHFIEPENPDNGKDFVIRIGSLEYSIEIKSAIENKESVKMSLRQGEDASKEIGHYSLCVISRPFGTLTTKDQFVKKAKFVTDIGEQIGDKVINWRTGLSKIESADNVSVELDSKNGYVNVRKATWDDGGIDFDSFIIVLKKYFKIIE